MISDALGLIIILKQTISRTKDGILARHGQLEHQQFDVIKQKKKLINNQ